MFNYSLNSNSESAFKPGELTCIRQSVQLIHFQIYLTCFLESFLCSVLNNGVWARGTELIFQSSPLCDLCYSSACLGRHIMSLLSFNMLLAWWVCLHARNSHETCFQWRTRISCPVQKNGLLIYWRFISKYYSCMDADGDVWTESDRWNESSVNVISMTKKKTRNWVSFVKICKCNANVVVAVLALLKFSACVFVLVHYVQP